MTKPKIKIFLLTAITVTAVAVLAHLLFINQVKSDAQSFYQGLIGYRYTSSSPLPQLTIEDFPSMEQQQLTVIAVDGTPLACYLYTAAESTQAARAVVVLSHGMWSSHQDYLTLIQYFVQQGYHVVAYDNTGHGQSGGKSGIGLPRAIQDLEKVLWKVAEYPPTKNLPLLLFGHSWGAYAVTAVLNADIPEIDAVAAISGFNTTGEVLPMIAKKSFPLTAPFMKRDFEKIEASKFGEYAQYTAVSGLNRFGGAAIVMHGEEDETIPLEASIAAHKLDITNPYCIVDVLPGRGHSFIFTQAATDYQLEIEQQYAELLRQNGGSLSDEKRTEFINQLDPFRAYEVDTAILKKIIFLFEGALI